MGKFPLGTILILLVFIETLVLLGALDVDGCVQRSARQETSSTTAPAARLEVTPLSPAGRERATRTDRRRGATERFTAGDRHAGFDLGFFLKRRVSGFDIFSTGQSLPPICEARGIDTRTGWWVAGGAAWPRYRDTMSTLPRERTRYGPRNCVIIDDCLLLAGLFTSYWLGIILNPSQPQT
jgi:hypothetical protein